MVEDQSSAVWLPNFTTPLVAGDVVSWIVNINGSYAELCVNGISIGIAVGPRFLSPIVSLEELEHRGLGRPENMFGHSPVAFAAVCGDLSAQADPVNFCFKPFSSTIDPRSSGRASSAYSVKSPLPTLMATQGGLTGPSCAVALGPGQILPWLPAFEKSLALTLSRFVSVLIAGCREDELEESVGPWLELQLFRGGLMSHPSFELIVEEIRRCSSRACGVEVDVASNAVKSTRVDALEEDSVKLSFSSGREGGASLVTSVGEARQYSHQLRMARWLAMNCSKVDGDDVPVDKLKTTEVPSQAIDSLWSTMMEEGKASSAPPPSPLRRSQSHASPAGLTELSLGGSHNFPALSAADSDSDLSFLASLATCVPLGSSQPQPQKQQLYDGVEDLWKGLMKTRPDWQKRLFRHGRMPDCEVSCCCIVFLPTWLLKLLFLCTVSAPCRNTEAPRPCCRPRSACCHWWSHETQCIEFTDTRGKWGLVLHPHPAPFLYTLNPLIRHSCQ